MNRPSTRIVVLQAIAVTLCVLPFLTFGAYVWRDHLRADARLTELTPRYARLLGVLAAHSKIQVAVDNAKATLHRHAYPAAIDTTKAGNDAQQRIRALFESSQLTIGSIQVLAAKQGEHFRRISVTLRAEGDLTSMQDVLLKLKSESPSILLDSLSLRNIGLVQPTNTQRLLGNFNFSVLQARS